MIIDTTRIEELVSGPEPAPGEVERAIAKGRMAGGLGLEEAAVLLRSTSHLDELAAAAREVKERVFGRRVVLFAPIYLSNYCTNGCLYCGFRAQGGEVARKALATEEVVSEARALEEMGFRRVLLVTGEDPRWGLSYIVSAVRAVYENTGIRIVHVNAPPMSTDELRELKSAGAGVFQVFQETYHEETYALMHPAGRKRDYAWRLSVMDRAMEAGFEDVGIGPLLGLYDHRFDALAALAHSFHLYERFGAHAHTISIPRLRPASGSALPEIPHPVSDDELKRVVAVFRLTVPSAGVVVSTREGAALRSELIDSGATQLSAGSRTDPGGYSSGAKALEQFSTDDHRTLSEVMASVIEDGYVPSLCTTCYRTGRTGDDFYRKTMEGTMERFCRANAVLTLKEYISEHEKNGLKSEPATRALLEKALRASLEEITDEKMKRLVIEKIKRIEAGERDLFF